eukprot:CAMPEP_0181481650 /NCGR_PEP_ID=MMETSP1110-20121109/44424_1 /TAXON_ID=174948 /ORGANISM="Symbiodinium sp., Strain CCMP421" /LENGTH=52 /DNA_ID=CAMNT_0023607155 /DNA_START=107 /DNA_END=265 /DNA_ORIENTATION=+
MWMQVKESGFSSSLPSKRVLPLESLTLNCLFTSATISPAALPTDFMVRAANQ